MDYYPVVVQVIPGEQRHIVAYFSDGRITRMDVQPLIDQGGVFEKLKDDVFFTTRLTVLNDTAAWDLTGKRDPCRCIDLDPIDLYNAEQIEDPLEEKLVS